MKTARKPRRVTSLIKDGAIYLPRNPASHHSHRRVIRVFQGRVFYSVGGDNNRHCLVETFRRWAAASKAEDATP